MASFSQQLDDQLEIPERRPSPTTIWVDLIDGEPTEVGRIQDPIPTGIQVDLRIAGKDPSPDPNPLQSEITIATPRTLVDLGEYVFLNVCNFLPDIRDILRLRQVSSRFLSIQAQWITFT